MGEPAQRVGALVMCVLVGLYVYLLGASASAAEGEGMDTIAPVYGVDEGGGVDGEGQGPNLGAGAVEEGAAKVLFANGDEAVGMDAVVTMGGSSPTLGSSSTLGSSGGLTIGSSGVGPGRARTLEYFLPAIVAGFICYRFGRWFYRTIVNLV